LATPRKRWFRVADSVLYEGWDDKTLATMIRLSAYLNTRWAREGLDAESAGRGTMPPQAALLITNTSRIDRALAALRQLAASFDSAGGLAVSWDGASVTYAWPKYAEFQQFPTPKMPPPRPPPRPPPTKSKNKSKKPAPTRRSTRTFPPEGLSVEEQQSLVSWAAAKGFGPDLVDAKVEAIRDWALAKDVRRADWVATIRGAIRRDGEGKTNGSNHPRSTRGGGRSQTPLADAIGAFAERRRF